MHTPHFPHLSILHVQAKLKSCSVWYFWGGGNAILVFKIYCENIQWCENTCYLEVDFKACENIHLSKNTDYSPSYNYMEKADLLYFEVEAPNGINVIKLQDRSGTFSAKVRQKKKLRCVLSNKHVDASK